MRFATLFISTCALLLSACGAVRSEPRFQAFGEADLERDARVIEEFRKSRDGGASHDDVKVLLDTVPEGIKTSEGSFSVEDGFAHVILGKFTLIPGRGLGYWFTWFPDYEDSWRKGVCYWQIPLHWVTMGLWAMVPTSYPCFTTPARSKISLVRDAKTLAAASGADTVIVSFVGANQEEAVGAAGLLIRLDPRMKSDGIKTKPFKQAEPMTAENEAPADTKVSSSALPAAQ
jgi:hypothetical protein